MSNGLESASDRPVQVLDNLTKRLANSISMAEGVAARLGELHARVLGPVPGPIVSPEDPTRPAEVRAQVPKLLEQINGLDEILEVCRGRLNQLEEL